MMMAWRLPTVDPAKMLIPFVKEGHVDVIQRT